MTAMRKRPISRHHAVADMGNFTFTSGNFKMDAKSPVDAGIPLIRDGCQIGTASQTVAFPDTAASMLFGGFRFTRRVRTNQRFRRLPDIGFRSLAVFWRSFHILSRMTGLWRPPGNEDGKPHIRRTRRPPDAGIGAWNVCQGVAAADPSGGAFRAGTPIPVIAGRRRCRSWL